MRRLGVRVEQGVTRQRRFRRGRLQGLHGQRERGVPADERAHAAVRPGAPQQPRLRRPVGPQHPPPVPGQPLLAHPVHPAGHGQARAAPHLVVDGHPQLVQPGVDPPVEDTHRERGHHRGAAQRPARGQGPLQPAHVGVEDLGVPRAREHQPRVHPDPVGEAVRQHREPRRGHGHADERIGTPHRPVQRAGSGEQGRPVMGPAGRHGHGDVAHGALAHLEHGQQEVAGPPCLGGRAARRGQGVVEVAAQHRIPDPAVELPRVTCAEPRRDALGHQLPQQRSSSLTNHDPTLERHDIRQKQ